MTCSERFNSDFVECRKRYNNQSRGVYISSLEHCRKMKFKIYLHLKIICKMFLCCDSLVILWCVVQYLYIWQLCLKKTVTLMFSSSIVASRGQLSILACCKGCIKYFTPRKIYFLHTWLLESQILHSS